MRVAAAADARARVLGGETALVLGKVQGADAYKVFSTIITTTRGPRKVQRSATSSNSSAPSYSNKVPSLRDVEKQRRKLTTSISAWRMYSSAVQLQNTNVKAIKDAALLVHGKMNLFNCDELQVRIGLSPLRE